MSKGPGRMRVRTDNLEEGQLRFELKCNVCDAEIQVTAVVPEDLRDTLASLIRDEPEEALALLRDLAFVGGWMAFPMGGGTVDVCPRCSTLMRVMASRPSMN